jgi:hypothetical protein
MNEYPATTKAELFAALRRVPDDAEIRIPSDVAGITVPLGRVLTGLFVGDPADDAAENLFDTTGSTRSAVALLPDDGEEEVKPAGGELDARPESIV